MFSEDVCHMGVRPTQCVSFGPPILGLFGAMVIWRSLVKVVGGPW